MVSYGQDGCNVQKLFPERSMCRRQLGSVGRSLVFASDSDYVSRRDQCSLLKDVRSTEAVSVKKLLLLSDDLRVPKVFIFVRKMAIAEEEFRLEQSEF